MMMSDPALQHPQGESNNQPVVTQQERQVLLNKLTSKWTAEISKRVETLAFEKSRGVKSLYLKFVQSYYQQVQNVYQHQVNSTPPAAASRLPAPPAKSLSSNSHPPSATANHNLSTDVLHQYVVGDRVASPAPGGDRLLQQILQTGSKGVPPTSKPVVTRPLSSTASGSLFNPDEETLSLIKYLRENIGKLQIYGQKFLNDGNLRRARDIQSFHQQTLQFISYPTVEGLAQAKQIRQMLEQAHTRSQAAKIEPSTVNFAQVEKGLVEYFAGDQKKRSLVSSIFMEPLSDVLNGVPHKRIRLDTDEQCFSSVRRLSPPSFFSRLHAELNNLPSGVFSVELIPSVPVDDELLSKSGVVLRCRFCQSASPAIPSLRLRVSTRYPTDPPEVLSLTNTLPPKLEFSEGQPFFEELSTNFVSHLFQLAPQHTISDLLTIWRQSVPVAFQC